MKQYKTAAALVMLCVIFIFGGRTDVKADSAEGTNENISWKLEDGVLTIWGKGDMPECGHKKMRVYEETLDCYENNADWNEYKEIESIVIKEGVTSISSHAFFDLHNAKSISIPSTVKTIGHAAFARSGFCQITVPDSVTSIGEGAFLGCSSLEQVTLSKNITKIRKMAFDGCYSLKQVNIPKKVKTIGKYAFEGCSLKQISIPSKVKTIEEKAFRGCEGLEQVNMEKKSRLQKIGAYAFSGCHIKKWTMPASVTEIGSAALGGVCKIQVEKGNKKYKSRNGILFSKNGKTLVCYPEHREKSAYTIPKGVKTIGSYAFNDNVNLKKVIMPDSVTVVEERAFFGAEKLKTVRFSKNLKRVEEDAFGGCDLSSLKLPDSLEVIGRFAFNGSSIKGTLVIPKNVKEIGYQAFFVNPDKVKKILVQSKKLKKVDKQVVFSTKKVTVILPKSKKESYQKFFTKKRQGKNIKFLYR